MRLHEHGAVKGTDMKTSLKVALSTALAAMVVLAMAVPAFASGGFFPKTGGDVNFVLNGLRASAEFAVRATGAPAVGEDHAPATGTFAFQTKGLRYVAKISHVHAHSATEVHFGGSIVKSSDPSMVGKFVQVAVVDGGTPGRNGDTISVLVTDTDTHAEPTAVPVTGGNLFVQTN
jgi:hypothetical protein